MSYESLVGRSRYSKRECHKGHTETIFFLRPDGVYIIKCDCGKEYIVPICCVMESWLGIGHLTEHTA
jgi:hypothetical protein